MCLDYTAKHLIGIRDLTFGRYTRQLVQHSKQASTDNKKSGLTGAIKANKLLSFENFTINVVATLTLDLRWSNWRSSALLHHQLTAPNYILHFYGFLSEHQVHEHAENFISPVLFFFFCVRFWFYQDQDDRYFPPYETPIVSRRRRRFPPLFFFFYSISRRCITRACFFFSLSLFFFLAAQRRKAKKKINTKVCCKVCCKSKYTSTASSSLSLVLVHETPAELCLCESYLYLYCNHFIIIVVYL